MKIHTIQLVIGNISNTEKIPEARFFETSDEIFTREMNEIIERKENFLQKKHYEAAANKREEEWKAVFNHFSYEPQNSSLSSENHAGIMIYKLK